MKQACKQILAVLFILCLSLCALAGCNAPTEPVQPAESTTNEPIHDTEGTAPSHDSLTEVILDNELQRAQAAGFLPEEWLDDMTAAVTFKEYCQLTNTLITYWNKDRLSEWENTIAAASLSDEVMLREDGILMMSYVTVLMGRNVRGEEMYPWESFPRQFEKLSDEERDAEMQHLSWDYPYFPDWDTTQYPVYGDSNYMWGGICDLTNFVWSRVSGLPVFSYDRTAHSLHLEEPFTRDDAVRSVLRMAESDPVILEPEGVYVPLEQVGTYNKEIITDTLLNASSNLPEVTQSKLPDEWNGAGIIDLKISASSYNKFRKADFHFLADNGFNFARVGLDFNTLRFPDYAEDPRSVNIHELEELDEMIAWGIENGVHVQLVAFWCMDQEGNSTAENHLPEGSAEWALWRDYWAMLARRYADIPSKYLSFELSNESIPKEYQYDTAQKEIADTVAVLREISPDRVLSNSFPGGPPLAWVERMASIGLALGCHPYYPNYITGADWEYAEENPYSEPCWPQPYFPVGNTMEGKAPIVITGDIGGAVLRIHIWNSNKDPRLVVYADNALLERFDLQGELDDSGEYYYYDTIYSVDIPDGAAAVQIEIEKADNTYARLDTIIVEKNGIKTVMVPSDTLDYPDYTDPLPLVINGDGTYTNNENRLIDAETVYTDHIVPLQAIAEQYGVGFMVNEFGIYGTDVDWDISVVTAFHDDILQMLTEKQIPWCYCEMHNTFPKHLISLYGNSFQWANTTEEEITYNIDGKQVTLTVNRDLLDVFRKYTMADT